MTNADVIRRMTDDELYEFLSEWECGEERKDMFQPKGRQNKRKTEPQVIACPIQEEDAEYARWLYEDEPQR